MFNTLIILIENLKKKTFPNSNKYSRNNIVPPFSFEWFPIFSLMFELRFNRTWQYFEESVHVIFVDIFSRGRFVRNPWLPHFDTRQCYVLDIILSPLIPQLFYTTSIKFLSSRRACMISDSY